MKIKKKTGHSNSDDLRKRAEKALRKNEANLTVLVENTKDRIWAVDAEYRLIVCNPQFLKGIKEELKREIVLGESVLVDSLPQAAQDEWRSYYDRALRGESFSIEKEMQFSKEPAFIDYRFNPIRSAEGKISGVVVSGRDITDRKRAEEALKKSSQLLRDTGEMVKVGGWELDLSTKEVIWTEEVRRIHGVEPGYKPKLEEALNFYAPESRPALEEALKKAMETGEPYDLESLFIPSGGQDKIWVRSHGKAVYNGDKIVKLAGTFQNIDKYKRAEEALRESEMRFRQVVENIREVFWIRDSDTRRILYVSPEYETIWGHALEEVYTKGLSFMENVHPEDEEQVSLSHKALYEEGRPFDEEYRIIRPDHSIRWVRARTYPVFDQNAKVSRLVGLAEDITERKSAEEALRKYEARLRTLSLELSHAEERERRRLALFLHDEIGQSLALLRMKLGEYAGGLELKSGKHDIGQICDLLEKAIDQTHALTFELSPPILHQLGLEAAIEWAGEKISQDQGIDFTFNDDGRLKPLDVDLKAFLFRCVRELMMNIVKHAKARRMAVSLTMTQNQVYATVEDNGIGFDTSLLERQPERVGFGLFSIRERLAAVDGTFELRSGVGRGTRVALSIPVK